MQDILMPDIELVQLLREGEEGAFEQIYERYWSSLYRIAVGKIQASDDAKEIVQDIFLDLWQRRGNVQIIDLEHYLKKAAKYKILDYFKKEVIRRQHEQFVFISTSQAGWDTEQELAFNDLNTALMSCIDFLPPKTKEIFHLSRVEYKSTEEISNLMDMPVRTVEYHITHGLKAVRLHLKDYLIYFLLIKAMVE